MGKRITVTPNVVYSLKVLEKAVKDLPDGETKEKAKSAIRYLLKTTAGEKQPGRGKDCVKPVHIFP